ncbi:hypothetical protein [Nocardia sp. NPDC051832]|uniref:hypothetical protein n=1 Tax=Nocardia sp. NPDC051832 TaxID=3155673 RepID=UPI003429EC23
MSWNAKGFGDLTPESPERSTEPAGATRRTRTPRQILIAGVIAVSLAVTGLLILNQCADDTTSTVDSGESVRLPHGPRDVRDGVPVGYSRDREGAATAAVNIVQALFQAGEGRVAMSAVETVLIARDPGPNLRRSIDRARDRAENSSVVNVMPAAVSVAGFGESGARVAVWMMAVSRSQINPQTPISVLTIWSTHTVDLVWEQSDWRAKESQSKTGPDPSELTNITKDSPLGQPLESGHYSIYVN